MTNKRQELGRKGEEIAASHLLKLGYRIIERNFRCRLGEIDMVAEEAGELVFVEVRTRSSHVFGLPEESVGWDKQARLRRLAQYYLISHRHSQRRCRFDVVSVTMDSQTGKKQVKVIKDAF